MILTFSFNSQISYSIIGSDLRCEHNCRRQVLLKDSLFWMYLFLVRVDGICPWGSLGGVFHLKALFIFNRLWNRGIIVDMTSCNFHASVVHAWNIAHLGVYKKQQVLCYMPFLSSFTGVYFNSEFMLITYCIVTGYGKTLKPKCPPFFKVINLVINQLIWFHTMWQI